MHGIAVQIDLTAFDSFLADIVDKCLADIVDTVHANLLYSRQMVEVKEPNGRNEASPIDVNV